MLLLKVNYTHKFNVTLISLCDLIINNFNELNISYNYNHYSLMKISKSRYAIYTNRFTMYIDTRGDKEYYITFLYKDDWLFSIKVYNDKIESYKHIPSFNERVNTQRFSDFVIILHSLILND